MYQNKYTKEIWKLDHVETVGDKKVYVFENGDRWAEDLFFTHWTKLD
jgi:hypothetical protein